MTTRRQHGWVILAGLSALLTSAALLAVVLTPVPLGPHLYLVGLIPFPVVGGLVVGRRPENLVGRLLVGAAAWFAIGAAANTYLAMSLDLTRPSVALAAWLATWVWWPALVVMAIVVGVFPTGRLTSSWLRWPLGMGLAAIGLLTLLQLIVPVTINPALFGEEVRNPWGLESLASLRFVGELLPAVATLTLAVVAVDLVGRWRSSRGVERLQMQWVGMGMLLLSLLAGAGVIAEAVSSAELVLVAVWIGFGILPASIGLAVTRYRLYEIDRLISRTVAYAAVVGLLAVVYTALVVGLPTVLPVSLDSPLLVAAATLTVAALFNPVRARVHEAVDRRFNRARYDSQREVERFVERIRTQSSSTELAESVLAVVIKTMQPATVSLWFSRGAREARRVSGHESVS